MLWELGQESPSGNSLLLLAFLEVPQLAIGAIGTAGMQPSLLMSVERNCPSGD